MILIRNPVRASEDPAYRHVAWLSDADFLAVRGPDIPGGGPMAAILRCAL